MRHMKNKARARAIAVTQEAQHAAALRMAGLMGLGLTLALLIIRL